MGVATALADRRVPLVAAGCAAAVVFMQILVVQQAPFIHHTFVGDVQTSTWSSAFEAVALICVARMVGVFLALGVTLAALGASFFLHEPTFLWTSIAAQVITLLLSGVALRVLDRRGWTEGNVLGAAITFALIIQVFIYVALTFVPGWQDRIAGALLLRGVIGGVIWGSLYAASLLRKAVR